MPEDLKIHWKALAGKYAPDEVQLEAFWQEIETAYTAANRHYHNLAHLQFLLNLAKRYAKSLKSTDAVCFAIFYHDLIYDATQTDNEAKSAAIAEERLTALTVPPAIIATVKAAIAATKTHEVNLNSDINFLLDFDLAILGADWETYQTYAKNIRQEYQHYPDDVYKPGRKKVLQHFLAMPRIYKTPLFQTLLEAKAHQNLQTELQRFL